MQDIATISHSGHASYMEVLLKNMQNTLRRGKMMMNANTGKTIKSYGGNTTNLMVHFKTNYII